MGSSFEAGHPRISLDTAVQLFARNRLRLTTHINAHLVNKTHIYTKYMSWVVYSMLITTRQYGIFFFKEDKKKDEVLNPQNRGGLVLLAFQPSLHLQLGLTHPIQVVSSGWGRDRQKKQQPGQWLLRTRVGSAPVVICLIIIMMTIVAH